MSERLVNVRLYDPETGTDWSGQLPDSLPEGYRLRFAQCAADFEED